MYEESLKRYFELESSKGDLSAEQWEAVLDRVRMTKQKRPFWHQFTWSAARRRGAHTGEALPHSTDSQSQAGPRPLLPWQRLVPASRPAWVVIGLVLVATLGAAGYAFGPTLGERLFSQVLDRWEQDYAAELSHEINMRETRQGVTVEVDRAYFERNRIGIEYTVAGLPQSRTGDSREFELYAELADARNASTRFRSAGGSGVRSDSQIEGMEVPPDTVTEVVAFDVTGAQADASGMRLSFVVSVDEMVGGGGDVLLRERTIGPFVFNFEVPFVPSTDIRVIHVGRAVEVSGVRVRLEEVTITPAEVTALIVADRTPEQRRANVRPEGVMLNVPGDWPADSPLPEAYVVTTLGDLPDTFLARFHLNWEAEPGTWRLMVENLRGVDDFENEIEVIGLWEFHFEVP